MGFFDDLWNSGREAVAGVGDAVAAGANTIGNALDYADEIGHAALGDAYEYIPIVSDITHIGGAAAHEVADAANLTSDVARGEESLVGALGRGRKIGERMGNTAADAAIAYTAGRLGGSVGKSWGKAATKGATKAFGNVGGKVATGMGKQVVGAVAGKVASNRLKADDPRGRK